MTMENKNILLPSKRYKKADSEDLSIRVGLDRDTSLLREGDRTVILDIAEQFRKERNESKKFKIYGKINMVFRNTYSGTTPYVPLQKNLYLLGDGVDGDYTGYIPYNEFAFLRTDYLREVSNPTASVIGGYTPNITLSGDTSHRAITQMESSSTNWNVHLSYVYDKDPDYPMRYTLSGGTVYNFTASNGIPFRVKEFTDYYELTSPSKHNMSQGEYVILSGSTISSGTEDQRIFNIVSVGNEIYESEYYVINLSKSEFTSSQSLVDGGVVFGKRCIDKLKITETTSQYYVHKHKILTNVDGCIVDKSGFETPIFEVERKLQYQTSDGRTDVLVEQNKPESILYHFKKELNIDGLLGHMGYSINDVYVTTVFRNGNGYFNYPPRLGWKFNLHNTWVDEQFNSTFTGSDTGFSYTTFNNGGFTFKKGDELVEGDTMIGSFVEYNEDDFMETVISESYHKFTINDSLFDHGQGSSTNGVGLIYKPHNKVKLRELSPYIETSDTDDILNLPENTKYDENIGLWKWRDLYDHGYIDPDGYGVNHPFTNGQHYVKSDINFYLINEETYTNKLNGVRRFSSGKDTIC